MTILQVLAADLAGVDLVFHAGRADGATLAEESVDEYARILCFTHDVSDMLDDLVGRKFPWGEPDGN